MPTPRHSVSVAGVVIDDEGRILAIRQQDNGHREPPGGVLELDETVEDSLVREIREETGLTVTPEWLTGVYKNMERSIVALVFRCSLATGNATIGSEAAEVAWLSAEEIGQRMDDAYAVRILDALRDSSPAIRAHNGVTLRPS